MAQFASVVVPSALVVGGGLAFVAHRFPKAYEVLTRRCTYCALIFAGLPLSGTRRSRTMPR